MSTLDKLIKKLNDIAVGLDYIHYDITDRECVEAYNELKDDVKKCIELITDNYIGE